MAQDRNLKAFQARIARLDKARRDGYGFQAPGTLGHSSRYKNATDWLGVLRKMIAVIVLILITKAVLFTHIGPEAYSQRLNAMITSTGLPPMAAKLMGADPATRAIASFIAKAVPGLRG